MNANQSCSLLSKLAFVSMLMPQWGVAQYVDVTATIDTFSWTRDGVRREQPREMHCVVGTNTWRMDGPFLQGAKSTAWFTDTNIVLNHELPKVVGADQRLLDYSDGPHRIVQVATSSGQRWTTITASLDGNPSRPARQADALTLDGRIAWLAFCSGSCLKREGRRLHPPSDLWKEVVRAPAGFWDQTVVFEDGLGLPKSVRLQTTNGLVVLQYGIVGSTNVCGWEFPLEFYLAQYRPPLSPGTNQIGHNGWEIDFISHGKVTAIGPGSEPKIPSEVTAALR